MKYEILSFYWSCLSLDSKPTMWLLTRSDTNRPVQAKRMARGWKFWIKFRKWRNCTICVAKTKAMICAFGFTYADCWFSHEVAHLSSGDVQLER